MVLSLIYTSGLILLYLIVCETIFFNIFPEICCKVEMYTERMRKTSFPSLSWQVFGDAHLNRQFLEHSLHFLLFFTVTL